MMRMEAKARAAIVRLAGAVFAEAILVVAGPAAHAHPFGFDTTKMVGFEVLTAEDGAMDARNMVVVKYDGPIVSPMATNLRAIWDEADRGVGGETGESVRGWPRRGLV